MAELVVVGRGRSKRRTGHEGASKSRIRFCSCQTSSQQKNSNEGDPRSSRHSRREATLPEGLFLGGSICNEEEMEIRSKAKWDDGTSVLCLELLLLSALDLPLSLGDLALLLFEVDSEESGSDFVGEGEDDGSARSNERTKRVSFFCFFDASELLLSGLLQSFTTR